MKTCTSCGASLQARATFCGDCGALAPVATTEEALASVSAANASAATGSTERPDQALDAAQFSQPQAPPEPPPLGAFCTNCGQKLPPNARFCGACGTQSLTAIPAIPEPADTSTAAAVTGNWNPRPPVAPAPPTTYTEMPAASSPPMTQTIAVPEESGGNKGRWIAAVVALVVLIAAAAAVAYIIGGRDSKTKASSTTSTTQTSGTSSTTGQTTSTTGADPAQFTAKLMSVVRADQGALSSKLAHLSLSGTSVAGLGAANQAAEQLRSDLKAQQATLTSAPDGVSQLGVIRQALVAHRGYAAAVVALTASSDAFSQATAQQVQHNGIAARALYTQLGQSAIAFEQDAHLVTLTTTLAQNRVEAAQQAAARAVMRGYLSRISAILEFSAQGRKNLNTIAANIRANRLDPSSGAEQISGVVSNRDAVISQIEQMQSSISSDANVPPQIGSLLGQLHTAMTNSEEADQAYESWAANLPDDYNYQDYGDTYNQAARDASQYDVAATAAKRSFVDQYDPLARSVGLASWSSSGF